MRGSREISLVPSLHRASTDALIDARIQCVMYFFHPFFGRDQIWQRMSSFGVCLWRVAQSTVEMYSERIMIA